MKITLSAFAALSSIAAASDIWSIDLSSTLAPANTRVGGGDKADITSAPFTSSPFSADTTHADLVTTLANVNTWYVSSGCCGDIGTEHVNTSTSGVVFAAGGPSGRSVIAGIKFKVTEQVLANYEGAITFSFDIAKTGGNNKSTHAFTFYLKNAQGVTLNSDDYTNKDKTGAITLTSTPQTVSLTFKDEQVAAMKAAGGDQTLVFVVSTNAVNGSNAGLLLNNVWLTPEPTTAALSLLALAGVAVRRRRK